ncbi:torsin-1A-interacting protein 1-like [Dermacentor andersoni]|uniref:torsin-1A-interacting protein 1-like n=2 Tax=Dermacentor andersoni TaxID=34620 RepID=UPI002155B62B|nr:torsin-1A-interacting protein 2-like [Dermacentor andersoni]XP_054918831.1 torsin-1A-interacting protein 2-like [Dermacentor andersoni]XP_054918832.1 torsin-1A-interacting protein 2-like [Dermacentor andersoni]XP_054918833.1 torsin-1A-interacting protein 2-like [Dermacentor andersoni]XP_054918834.1 torsin-1A-interacting protein 2-like [Dermacentor andersoni]
MMSSSQQPDECLARRGIHDRRSSHHDADLTDSCDDAEDQTDKAEHISPDANIEEPLAQESYAHKPSNTQALYPDLTPYKRRLSIPRSASPSRHKKELPPQSQQASYYLYVGALICALVLLVQYLISEQPMPLSLADRRLGTLREHLRKLKDTFVAQPEYNWQIIRSSVMDMINDTGVYSGPAVITFLASVKNERFATCLSQQVATALSYTFDDGGDYGTIAADELSVSEDVARHIIENRCKEVVERRQRHVMVASHLEKWNPDAAMMLHPLCDQENALYKNVTYILTVFTKHEDVSGQRERKEYDHLAENALNNAWESMDTNQRHAIISRVTGNVVLVREDSSSCVSAS